MALIPSPTTITTATPGFKKDLAYFQREVGTVTLAFWRSSKLLADVIIDARLALSPEEFKQLIAESQFDYTFVCKLVRQGSDYRLNDPDNEPILPEAFSSRHEIMLMNESTFRIGVTKNIINKNCKLEDLRKLREQMEGKKSKKTTPKKTATPSPRSSAVETTQDASSPVPNVEVNEPDADVPTGIVAVVKGTVNTSALRVIEKPATTTQAVMPVTAPEKCRIKIVLSREVADEHQHDVDSLKLGIDKLITMYSFITAVDIEVAA